MKRIFTKYIMAFMLILLACFLLILGIVSVIIGGYSEDNKRSMMIATAHSARAYLEEKAEKEGYLELFVLLSSEGDETRQMMDALVSATDDITLLLITSDGRILMSAGRAADQIGVGDSVPAELAQQVVLRDMISDPTKVDGVFDEEHWVQGSGLRNAEGQLFGGILVCTSSVMMTDLLMAVIRAIAIAGFGVFLAALIAVYLISERISAPLKDISRAAKEYAAGKFGTRVPVRGQDEVAQLAIAFNNMAESLDNYDTMRNTFISNVSHDLRSPMTSIAGFIDSILDGAIPPDQHTYYLHLVSDEIKRLSRLVASLLDLSRIQAGERKFTPVRFDVCEMGRQILLSFEQKIDDKHLKVEFDLSEDRMIAIADQDAIYQVLYNLCDNAVKFSAEGGLLRISVKWLKNRKLLVSVYNEGQGIASADLPYVFERFYKSDKSRGLNKSGVGLGLFISKTIVEAHGGSIWAESTEGKSCCFRFTLNCE